MHFQDPLKIFLGSLLVVLLLALQVQSAPTQPAAVDLQTARTLDTRGWRKFFKKFIKAKKGTCDDNCSLLQPQGPQEASSKVPPEPATGLEKLYSDIKDSDLVRTGATQHFMFDPQTPASYGASEIYGCTVVIVLDGHGAVIGHYPQEYGEVVTLEDKTATQKKIIQPLEQNLALIDFTTETQAYIVHSSSKDTVGYKAIVNALEDNDMSAENIHSMFYSGGKATLGDRGKIALIWQPKDDGGATLELYIQRQTPVYVRDFDANGNPCKAINSNTTIS